MFADGLSLYHIGDTVSNFSRFARFREGICFPFSLFEACDPHALVVYMSKETGKRSTFGRNFLFANGN